MGVAGSGKTTIGKRLAAQLGWPYHEADDFHSAANKDKMGRGIPLDDYDRAPWLLAIRTAMDDCLAAGESAVFTCSGLKEKYRRVLMDGAPGVSLVYLATDLETSLARVGRRQGHYMKAEMVKSQFDALEAPQDALVIDTKLTPEQIIAEIRRALSL
jgi:gluconokinase